MTINKKEIKSIEEYLDTRGNIWIWYERESDYTFYKGLVTMIEH